MNVFHNQTCIAVPRSVGDNALIEMIYWLQDHRREFEMDDYTVIDYMIYFKDPIDAVAFKLRFNL